MTARLLLVCPTPWELAALRTPEVLSRFELLVCADELVQQVGLWNSLRFRVFEYLDGLVERYRGENLVGVIGCGDYPGCLFAAYLAEKLGLPACPSRAVILLSHKAESRAVQARLVPEATPAFKVIGPWDRQIPLPVPFFVKPIKGTMSVRAQMVERAEQFLPAVRWSFRELILVGAILWPYGQMLKAHGISAFSIWSFIAEAPLKGVQVTVDGFVQNGVVTVMGVVDSVMFPGTISFRRFDYPSVLPEGVVARMGDITRRFVEGSGLDHTCFNLEFFYDAETDRVSIIELNPRMSYQFSDLYEAVDGLSSMEVQLALATGVKVPWKAGSGPYGVATSFVGRRFTDGRVTRVPSETEIQAAKSAFPSAHIEVLCKVGDLLSELPQDMGSFRYAITNLASQNRETLFAEYEQLEAMLAFEFE